MYMVCAKKQTNKHYVLMQHKIRWGTQSYLFRWHNMTHTIIHRQHAYNTNRTPTSPASSEMSLPNCQQIAPCQASFTHYTLGNTTAESNFLHLLLLISITYFNSNACDVARTEVHISGMNGGKGFWGRRGHCRKRAALTKSHSALGNPLN